MMGTPTISQFFGWVTLATLALWFAIAIGGTSYFATMLVCAQPGRKRAVRARWKGAALTLHGPLGLMLMLIAGASGFVCLATLHEPGIKDVALALAFPAIEIAMAKLVRIKLRNRHWAWHHRGRGCRSSRTRGSGPR